MNIALFDRDEIDGRLPIDDPRAQHALKVLKRRVGESFDVGIRNGARGKAIVAEIGLSEVTLRFEWGEEPSALYPIDLVVGLSRPQTNRKILQEATSLGVRSMRFATTERGEPSYADSKLWTTGEWERHVVAGVEQAFDTRVPDVAFGMGLEEALQFVGSNAVARLALDNYEATTHLGQVARGTDAFALAIGSERGWTNAERELLRKSGYTLVHLGDRPLRTETAVVAAISVCLAGIKR